MRSVDDKKRIIEALREVPSTGYACNKAGIPRSTFYRWRSQSARFRKQIEEAQTQGTEEINDLVQKQIIKAVNEGKWPQMKYWAEHHHPAYKPKAEIDEKDGAELPSAEQVGDGPMRLADAVRQAFALGKTTKDLEYEVLRKEVHVRRVRKGLAPEGLADDMLAEMIWIKQNRIDEGLPSNESSTEE